MLLLALLPYSWSAPSRWLHPPSHALPSPCRARAALSVANKVVADLSEGNFETRLGKTPALAVVKFYAPWCRTCVMMGPKFAAEAGKITESSDGQIEFFQVNFKENKNLCLRERVYALPAIHLYVPGVGRVGRFTCTAGNVVPKLRRTLGRYTSQPERLPALLSLADVALQPVVQYAQLVGVLQAMASYDGQAEDDPKAATLRESIEADEAYLADLQALFGMLDRNSDGNIDSAELEMAISALSVDGATDGAPSSLSLAPTSTLSESQRKGFSSAADGAASLTFEAFVRLMISKSIADYSLADKELMPAFRALDVDGGGTITMEEMTSTMGSVCATYPELCRDSELLPAAFEAFDLDDSGALDYEEFVSLASRRSSKVQRPAE